MAGKKAMTVGQATVTIYLHPDVMQEGGSTLGAARLGQLKRAAIGPRPWVL